MRIGYAILALAVWLPGAAAAQFDVVINNGDAPPNAANIIDSWANWTDWHYVRNEGCPPGWPSPGAYGGAACGAPGDPTEVEIAAGGRVLNLTVKETSSVVLDGGWVDRIDADDDSSATMDAGMLQYLVANDTAEATLNGGELSYLWALDDGTISMTGGEVYMVNAWDTSDFTMTGGTAEYVILRDDSVSMLTDGVVLHVNTGGNAVATLTNVTADFVIAEGSSQVTIMGGEIAYSEAKDDAVINVVGARFEVDGVPVPFGAVAARTGVLTGELASGDPISHEFHQGDGPGGEYSGTLSLAEIPAVPAMRGFGRAALAAALLAGFAVARIRRGA